MQGYDCPAPTVTTPLTEACVEGGNVRLRTPLGEPSRWRDYKAIDTDAGMVANFHNNRCLLDWVNAQPLAAPSVCRGDGQDGVWNIVAQSATPEQCRESLNWYHLNGGSIKRLRQAETLLWQGHVDETIALLADLKRKPAQTFVSILKNIATGLSTMLTTKRQVSVRLVLGQ